MPFSKSTPPRLLVQVARSHASADRPIVLSLSYFLVFLLFISSLFRFPSSRRCTSFGRHQERPWARRGRRPYAPPSFSSPPLRGASPPAVPRHQRGAARTSTLVTTSTLLANPLGAVAAPACFPSRTPALRLVTMRWILVPRLLALRGRILGGP